MKLAACAAMLALFVTACSRTGSEEESEDKKPSPVVEVTLTKATSADIPLHLDAPASVFPHEQASIAARVTAPIRRLMVRKGDNVKAGQVLAELESRDVAAQLAEARGAVATAEATLQKTVGGTLPSDVERARGQVETTKAALDQMEQLYRRRKSLFDEGAIPQRDLLQTQTDLATARANYEVAKRSYDLLVNQSRGRDEQIARANLEQAQARLQGAGAQLQFTELRAPFAGTVTDQFQYPGDMAQPSSPIFSLADLSSISARGQVPEADAGQVKRGQSCTFHSLDQQGAQVAGSITVVNRAVDPQRRTVEVWCEISNPPSWIRAGMFGRISILTGELKSAVVVPRQSLLQQEGTNDGSVFVVDDQRVAHQRDVVVGNLEAGQAMITSGLKAGETVVVEGAYGLPDKAKVTLKGEKAPDAKDDKE